MSCFFFKKKKLLELKTGMGLYIKSKKRCVRVRLEKQSKANETGKILYVFCLTWTRTKRGDFLELLSFFGGPWGGLLSYRVLQSTYIGKDSPTWLIFLNSGIFLPVPNQNTSIRSRSSQFLFDYFLVLKSCSG